MPLLILLALGAALGWLVAIVLRNDSLRESLINIAAGATGAVSAFLLAGGTIDSRAIGIDSLLIGAAGAIVLVAVAVFLRRPFIR